MIFSLGGKAVFAAEIAGVCHMEAQSLNSLIAVFQVAGVGRIAVLREKLALRFQLRYVGDAIGYFFRCLRWKYLKQLIIAALLSVLLAVAPMAIGVA